MVQMVASTKLVIAEGTAAIVKMLSEEAVKCQPMGMVDQGFWCIDHSKAMSKPADAEFAVLRPCSWEDHIKTAYLMETIL